MKKDLKYNSDSEKYFTEFKNNYKIYKVYFSKNYYKTLSEKKLKNIIHFINSTEFKTLINTPIPLLSLLAKNYFKEYDIIEENLKSEFNFNFVSISYEKEFEYELEYYLYLPVQKEGDNYGTWKSTHQDFGGNEGSNTIIKIEREQQ